MYRIVQNCTDQTSQITYTNTRPDTTDQTHDVPPRNLEILGPISCQAIRWSWVSAELTRALGRVSWLLWGVTGWPISRKWQEVQTYHDMIYHDMIRQKVHHDVSRLMPRFAVDAQVWIPVVISNLEDLVAIAYPGLKTTRHGYPKFWCFIHVYHIFALKRTILDHFGESLFGWLNPPFLPRLCRLPSLHPSVHDERLKRLAQEAWHDWTDLDGKTMTQHGSKGWKRRPVLWVSYVFVPSSSSRFFICLFILFLFFGPRSQEMILDWQKNNQVIPENHRCWLNAMTCPWVPWWKWPRCPAAVQSGVGVDEAIHRYP